MGGGAGLASAFCPSDESLTGLAPARLGPVAFELPAFSGLTAAGRGAGLAPAFFPSDESLTGLAPAHLRPGAFGSPA